MPQQGRGMDQYYSHACAQLVSQPQATVLALWSLGMVLAPSCALTAVSMWLATTLQRKEGIVRQQWREWSYEAEAKRDDHQQALGVLVWLTGGRPLGILRQFARELAAENLFAVLALERFDHAENIILFVHNAKRYR